ncbi:hypothetical protein PYW07_000646 [Mythimna separata]|uniref:Uncharacterized protein n=1 Tax=Mythimna separata TaxID=271217 RepID=A0AAD7Z3X1_MYTSE|nr:hypothetical protein PYW07_000646 [Mythimna separata]
MKCARLHLQQRPKSKTKRENSSSADKPRRYCQKRLVNPDHEEDPRWIDIFDRFHCNMNNADFTDAIDSVRAQDAEDMVLTVQTLKFQGDVDQTSRPRTSFKYKKNTDGKKHRMFVKQAVSDNESDDDRSSQLTYQYFDEYMKYIYNSDRSRPASRTSSIFLRGFSNDKDKEKHETYKPTHVETNANETKKSRKTEAKIKNNAKKIPERQMKDEIRDVSETIENTKITYQKTGKRKSLTISRAQSPETVQVIRVDVVCNYTNSSSSDYEDNKRDSLSDRSAAFKENAIIKKDIFATRYSNHLASRYLLTNSIKSVDENLSGGSKVTLLCKTFKLSDRNIVEKPEKEKKFRTSKKKYKLKSNKVKHHEIVY